MPEYDPETMQRQAATIRKEVGPTILLGSGTYFDFLDPASSKATIDDVAYALGFECRFCGQCVERATGKRVFYPVAQHCVEFSKLVRPEFAYDALMHEVGEMPCGDINSPLKTLCPEIKAIEKGCEAGLLSRFSVPMIDKGYIKEYDILMLAWERRDLMPWNGEQWSFEPKYPIPTQLLHPMGPYEAAEAFIRRFAELAPASVLADADINPLRHGC